LVSKRTLYSLVAISLIAITVAVIINSTVKQNFKEENPELNNQTIIEQNITEENSTSNNQTIIEQNMTYNTGESVHLEGVVQNIISECAPSPLKSKNCVFFNLIVLYATDGKTYALSNLNFSYTTLQNKQVEITGILDIPSKSKLSFIFGDLNVTKYSIIGNSTIPEQK